jgi:hypothetical protein
MARRKAPPPSRRARPQAPAAEHHHGGTPPQEVTTRRFLNRGVLVEISESPGDAARGASHRVALTLDGVPIDVTVEGGEYFAHEAHMFTGFGSMDVLVDHLLANEGRLWTLHGHVCDERCRGGHHHHGDGSGHGHGPGPVTPDHPHDHGGDGRQHGDDEERRPAARRTGKAPRRGGAR